MSDSSSDNSNTASDPLESVPGMGQCASILQAVGKNPISLFGLAILGVTGSVQAFLYKFVDQSDHFLAGGFFFLMALVVSLVGAIALWRPEIFIPTPPSDRAALKTREGQELIASANETADVIFENVVPARLDYWYREMQPLLYQAAHYSVPIYYLDQKLRVMDWNVAFATVFGEMAGAIRGKHVNLFINRLANYNDVYNHAKVFTRDVIEQGAFPYVDMEPVHYQSSKFGLVKTLKIASQLTDSHGESRGWAVALVPTEINWTIVGEKLWRAIHDDKMWSVYAASYDRVLQIFPPYKQLIQDVIRVVPYGPEAPENSTAVLDIGCGTGNVSVELVNRGYRVTAIENNLGMLERFVSKGFDPEKVTLIKSSVEQLDFLEPDHFDAAVMVNVLYALDEPIECLRSLHRALRPNGVLGLSTTHRETNLDPLLEAIQNELKRTGKTEELAADWDNVYNINRRLEKTIVKRHTRDQIHEMIKLAGFEVIHEIRSTYLGAVTVIHARKPE